MNVVSEKMSTSKGEQKHTFLTTYVNIERHIYLLFTLPSVSYANFYTIDINILGKPVDCRTIIYLKSCGVFWGKI